MKIDEKLIVLEEKIDKLSETNSRQDVHLERLTNISESNTHILREHMRRTEANETRIIQVETALVKHLSFIKGAVWVVGCIIGSFAVVKTLIDLGIF